jgi:hypothetical protein
VEDPVEIADRSRVAASMLWVDHMIVCGWGPKLVALRRGDSITNANCRVLAGWLMW